MHELNLAPSNYAVRVDSFDFYRRFKITAKNKMQSAQFVECDFINKRGQTTKFYDKEQTIRDNYRKAIDFINELGPVNKEKVSSLNNSFAENVWFDQATDKVIDFISSLEYPNNQSALIDDKEGIKNWFEKAKADEGFKNFNIVLSTPKQGNNGQRIDDLVHISNFHSVKRMKLNKDKKGIIDLKTITNSNDFFADIECDTDITTRINQYNNDDIPSLSFKRNFLGMEKTPLLVLYIIDKDSGKDEEVKEGSTRIPLNTCEHLVGYYIYIPYGNRQNHSQVNKVSVRLEFYTNESGDSDEDEM